MLFVVILLLASIMTILVPAFPKDDYKSKKVKER